MADYVITGRKGNGKGLYAVLIIQDALREGKKVATNLNIFPEHLVSATNKSAIIRIPDRPTVADLDAIGRGQDGVVEEDNGVLILDECSHFLNSRDWSDKSRQGVLDWLTMSRKLGWDTYLISQGVEQLDKQVRTSLCEYRIDLKRTDKWGIPIITAISRFFVGDKKALRFPKFHVAVTKQGMDRQAFHIGSRFFRGGDLWPAYETQQIFVGNDHPAAVALHTVLPNWYTKGRYLPVHVPLWRRLLEWGRHAKHAGPTQQPAPPHIAYLRTLPPDLAFKIFRLLLEGLHTVGPYDLYRGTVTSLPPGRFENQR